MISCPLSKCNICFHANNPRSYECYFKQYSESHGVENSPASQLEVRVQSHPGLNFLDLSVTAHKVVLVTVRII